MADTPAYKTLPFWATVLMTNVGLLMVSGLLIEGTAAQVIGWLVATLTALGYKGWAKPELPPAA